MDEQQKLMYTASGCMTFICSMANQHHVPLADLYEVVGTLCSQKAKRENSLDPDRNK